MYTSFGKYPDFSTGAIVDMIGTELDTTSTSTSTTGTEPMTGTVLVPKNVIKTNWEGLLTREGLVITTPGVTMPSQLLDWVKSWAKVKRLAIADTDTYGTTDYFGVAWESSIDVDMFASTIIEMVCHYFGWDRSMIQFEGDSWTEGPDEMAFAKTALASDVPPLGFRVLSLGVGLTYLLPGTRLEVTEEPEGTVIRVISVAPAVHQGTDPDVKFVGDLPPDYVMPTYNPTLRGEGGI